MLKNYIRFQLPHAIQKTGLHILHILCTALIIVVPIFLIPLKDSENPDNLHGTRSFSNILANSRFLFNAFVLYPGYY